jgi:hypothetical protein
LAEMRTAAAALYARREDEPVRSHHAADPLAGLARAKLAIDDGLHLAIAAPRPAIGRPLSGAGDG